MTELDIKLAYEKQKPVLQAWGDLVQKSVVESLEKQLGISPMKSFLKIRPEPRVKDTESFLSKAIQRKSYKNPLDDITDRVGLRFVVLLRSEIKIIEQIIESCELWEFSKDRDFEAEAAEKPQHFDYQSIHYVLRAKKPHSFRGVEIPAGLPCELQVRTLLQHAYAELAHDRIYKSAHSIAPETMRDVAKSAALVETTDEIFGFVDDRLESAVARLKELHLIALNCYENFLKGWALDEFRFSRMLLSNYLPVLDSATRETLQSFLDSHDFIREKVEERAPLSILYQHPAVLWVYFIVESEPNSTPNHWPFDQKFLEPIYADLGISTDGKF